MTRVLISCLPTKTNPVATAPGTDKPQPDPVDTAPGTDKSQPDPVATAPDTDKPRSLLQGAVTHACYVFVCVFLFQLVIAPTQSQSDEKQPTGVLRLKVKPKINGKDKELARKRFYLIKGSLEENKAFVDKINQQSYTTRDCFYRNAKVSEAFINWLKDGDCESVYCRPVEEQFLTGPMAVPEFQLAYQQSIKEYKTPYLGRLWLTTNLSGEVRDGFYRQRQVALKALISDASAATNAPVVSVMTDRKGTAYFTDLTQGTYLVTNLIPSELGDNTALWTCEVKVGAAEKRLQIPNVRDKNVKCVVIEKPLPACNAIKQTASIR